MEAEGNFIKIAAIGVYLEDTAVPALAGKWAGKTADELASDPTFFRDVYTGKPQIHALIGSPPAGDWCLRYMRFDHLTHGRRRVREVHEGDVHLAEDRRRRGVRGEGDGEPRGVPQGHRRVHGRRGRGRGGVQGGIQEP